MPSANSELKTDATSNNMNYYNAPYGYHTSGTDVPLPNTQATQQQPQPTALAPTAGPDVLQHQSLYQQPQSNTYMQSGSCTTANTQTTKSSTTYATSSQQSPMTPAKTAAVKPPVNPTTAAANKPLTVNKKSSNIDLLSDIDFSGVAAVPPPILPEPLLKPKVVSSPPASQVAVPITPKKLEKEAVETIQKEEKLKQVEVG